MRTIDENSITSATIEQMATTKDSRLKEIMESLVRHLHAFAREVDLKPEEWLEGIKFLTAVGQKCRVPPGVHFAFRYSRSQLARKCLA